MRRSSCASAASLPHTSCSPYRAGETGLDPGCAPKSPPPPSAPPPSPLPKSEKLCAHAPPAAAGARPQIAEALAAKLVDGAENVDGGGAIAAGGGKTAAAAALVAAEDGTRCFGDGSGGCCGGIAADAVSSSSVSWELLLSVSLPTPVAATLDCEL